MNIVIVVKGTGVHSGCVYVHDACRHSKGLRWQDNREERRGE
jgi:hypothetical protein